MVIQSAWHNYPELVDADDGYLSSGVTSLDIMDLILRLEEEFDIEFSVENLELENFDSFESICATIGASKAMS